MNTLEVILVLLSLILQIHSLFIALTPRETCIKISQQPNVETHFYYQITGNSPENAEIKFKYLAQNLQPFSMIGQRGNTKFNSTKMEVCFISLDSNQKSISIDYYPQSVAHLAKLASKGDMHQMHNKLIEVGQKLRNVNRYETFQEEKQAIQGTIINENQTKVKIIVAIKVLCITLVAMLQAYLLKIFLGKNEYTPINI